ncbi:MAG: flavodoxin [Lachnospiraceae bacterium]|jgi:flavodoxin
MSKKLVAYFSCGGRTAKRARELAKVTGADLFVIEPAQPYTEADLDWANDDSRCTKEMTEEGSESIRPEMKEKKDISDYDIVYIGFPVWWGKAPRIINTFIESADFAGKTVMFFATGGGTDIDAPVKYLKETYPSLNIAGGKLLSDPVKADIL